jgi:MinD-like ATPase involved in chromosome partitioning or flagellar assembly
VHGLADLLAYPTDSLDLPTIEAALTQHRSGLSLLASTVAPVEVARASVILTQLRTAFDVCLFDLGAGLSQTAQAIAPRSNVLVLAIDSDRVTLAQAEKVISCASEAGSAWPEVKLVRISRLGAPDDAAQSAIRSTLGKEATVIGPSPDAMYQVLESGQPLVMSQPDHPVAVQIRTLAASLVSAA